MAAETAEREHKSDLPRAPRAYRIANFLMCSVMAWPILFGVACIDARPLRLLVAGLIAIGSSFMGLMFERLVDGAVRQAAGDAVQRITREVRRRRLEGD